MAQRAQAALPMPRLPLQDVIICEPRHIAGAPVLMYSLVALARAAAECH